MNESPKKRSCSQKRQTEQRNVALYPQDVESVRAIQAHHKLDSFSQAVRRAIRDTVETLNGSTESERAA